MKRIRKRERERESERIFETKYANVVVVQGRRALRWPARCAPAAAAVVARPATARSRPSSRRWWPASTASTSPTRASRCRARPSAARSTTSTPSKSKRPPRASSANPSPSSVRFSYVFVFTLDWDVFQRRLVLKSKGLTNTILTKYREKFWSPFIDGASAAPAAQTYY